MEIKTLVDLVSKEQGLKKEVVAGAVTKAMEKVFQKKTPDVRVEAQYDKDQGNIRLYQFKTVVDSEPEMLDEETEINLPEAKKIDPDCDIGDELGFEMSADLGRIDASVAKSVISEAIGIAQNEIAYETYLPLKGTVVTATVQRVDRNGALVTLGKVDAYIPRHGLIEREILRRSQSVDVYIEDVVMDKNRCKIILSRKSPELVVAAFRDQVPEIEDGSITVVDCVREAGVKTKLIVDTQERYNPVAVCIGTAGYRIQKVQYQIGGERVDVVQYTRNEEEFTKALLGAKRIYGFTSTDEEVTCQVEKEEVGRVVGLAGVNIKLASKALGKRIKVSEKGSEVVINSETAETVTVGEKANG